ncbi:unnamed protein product [Caenorhabditis angaria]|uniref:Protein-tyrosine-phosphatase n=1 Tax=Caenorhabditis angaria TaxID=860376 RepID=A0A9P1MU51_9PELO|nr:unnamed protein product [Caenorhabditis angaria]
MDASAIGAYAFTAISILILAIVVIWIVLWKWTRKLVYELLTKTSRIIFSITHLVPLIVLIACFVVFQPWNAYSGGIESKEREEMKTESEILKKTANDAFDALSGASVVIPVVSIDAMLDKTKIIKAVDKEMHVELPETPNMDAFVNKEKHLDSVKNSGSCKALKDLEDTSIVAATIRSALTQFSKNSYYSDDLDIVLTNENARLRNMFNNDINGIAQYAENMKTNLITKWRASLLQFDDAIDVRWKKIVEHLDSILLTILVTDISLLYVPSAFALMFLIFSIVTIWTTEETSANRILFIINRLLFCLVAIILIACSIYPFFEFKPDCPIVEDKNVYFNFPIPTRNGAKNSHDILSTCSGNLFDSPNDDVLLLVEIGFFKYLKQLVVDKIVDAKKADEQASETSEKIDTLKKAWENKRTYVLKLGQLPADCDSSKTIINEYTSAFNAQDGKMKAFIGALKQRQENVNVVGEKVGKAIDEHVQEVSGMIATQVTKVNSAIKILSVNCRTTRALFARINNIKCSNGGEFKSVALTRAIVVFVLGLCSIYILFTYRAFGPLPRDDRVKWSEKISELTFEEMKKLFVFFIGPLKQEKEVFPLKTVRTKVKYRTPCVKETRIVLKNPKNDFIHANRVKMPNNSIFIATNAPLMEDKANKTDDTSGDFWEMVWQEKVNTIAMLCQVIEDGRQRCAQYFPEKEGNVLKFGDFAIKFIEIKKSDDLPSKTIWRRFELTNKKFAGEKRMINHINFVGWPDFSVPDDPKLVINLVKFVCETNENNAPIVVHCVAGLGRTGVFLAYAYAREFLKTFCDLNLVLVIKHIRAMRDSLIQNSLQYAFVFVCLVKSFQMDGLIKQKKIQRFLMILRFTERNLRIKTIQTAKLYYNSLKKLKLVKCN